MIELNQYYNYWFLSLFIKIVIKLRNKKSHDTVTIIVTYVKDK